MLTTLLASSSNAPSTTCCRPGGILPTRSGPFETCNGPSTRYTGVACDNRAPTSNARLPALSPRSDRNRQSWDVALGCKPTNAKWSVRPGR
ncbi:hypothetical protein GCM10009634_55080 [Saccharothrix xinjiangensis]